MILIGSYAFRKVITNIQKDRKHPFQETSMKTVLPVEKDIDIIAKPEELKTVIEVLDPDLCYPNNGSYYGYSNRYGKPLEIHIAWENTNELYLYDLVEDDPDTVEYRMHWKHALVPSLDVLYMLKMSHRFLKDSPHFEKTMHDIHQMRNLGAKFNPHYQDWYNQREKRTYNYTHPKLNRKKHEFFNPSEVKYKYDHDSIHEAVKIGSEPAYTYFMKPGAEVMVSKKKWNELPHLIKINSVLEESYVLAIERSQVPFEGKISPIVSFRIALKKVCTSISSGWWREFAWENYYEVLSRYDPHYMTNFQLGIKNGIVKEHKNETDVSKEVRSKTSD